MWVSGFRDTVQTRGRKQAGRARPATGCLCWSDQWLVCLACFSVVGPDTESGGCWHLGLGSVSSLVDALAAYAG